MNRREPPELHRLRASIGSKGGGGDVVESRRKHSVFVHPDGEHEHGAAVQFATTDCDSEASQRTAAAPTQSEPPAKKVVTVQVEFVWQEANDNSEKRTRNIAESPYNHEIQAFLAW